MATLDEESHLLNFILELALEKCGLRRSFGIFSAFTDLVGVVNSSLEAYLEVPGNRFALHNDWGLLKKQNKWQVGVAVVVLCLSSSGSYKAPRGLQKRFPS